jgi:hypothetical protein
MTPLVRARDVISRKRLVSDPERRSFDIPKMGSDRNFGVVFAVFFLILGVLPSVSGDPLRLWAFIASGVLFALALVAPQLLAIPNRVWYRIGLLLGKVVTPILMGALFLTAIIPVAFVLRLFGKDLLRLERQSGLRTYWLPKTKSAVTPASLKDQF